MALLERLHRAPGYIGRSYSSIAAIVFTPSFLDRFASDGRSTAHSHQFYQIESVPDEWVCLAATVLTALLRTSSW
jgi:hypothetical protein